jgi:hypothetical protein
VEPASRSTRRSRRESLDVNDDRPLRAAALAIEGYRPHLRNFFALLSGEFRYLEALG